MFDRDNNFSGLSPDGRPLAMDCDICHDGKACYGYAGSLYCSPCWQEHTHKMSEEALAYLERAKNKK